MKRKSTRKPAAVAVTPLTSPPPPPSAAAATPSPSPAPKFNFDFNGFSDIASSLKKKSNNKIGTSASKLKNTAAVTLSPVKNVHTISDLKDLASSTLDSLKRQLDRSHNEISKDVDSSHSRLHKRFKIQTQQCQQLMDDAEKEYKKVSERINEGREAMKASYAEFIAEAQAAASRICKKSIPELSQTLEKGIAALQSRYGISSTTA